MRRKKRVVIREYKRGTKNREQYLGFETNKEWVAEAIKATYRRHKFENSYEYLRQLLEIRAGVRKEVEYPDGCW